MEKKTIEIEKTLPKEQVADFFRQLAEELKNGSVEIKDETETLTLTPPNMISVEISAKQKKDKSKLTIEMSWRCQELVQDIEKEA